MQSCHTVTVVGHVSNDKEAKLFMKVVNLLEQVECLQVNHLLGEIHQMIAHANANDDFSDIMDQLVVKGQEAIEKADAVVIVAPEGFDWNPVAHNAFWMGVAYSNGIPNVLYVDEDTGMTKEDARQLNPVVANVVHVLLFGEQELLAYAWEYLDSKPYNPLLGVKIQEVRNTINEQIEQSYKQDRAD